MTRHRSRNSRKCKLLHHGLIQHIILTTIGYLLNVLLLVLFPTLACFPGNVVSGLHGSTFLEGGIKIVIIYLMPSYILFQTYWHLCTYVVLLSIPSMFVIPFILKEFRVDKPSHCYIASPKLRIPPLLQTEWRAAEILVININNVFGLLLIPVQTLMMNLVIFSVILVTRHYKHMHFTSLVLYIGWPIVHGGFWTILLLIGGYLHLYSGKTLRSWKYHQWDNISTLEKKVLLKFVKGCKPLAIAYERTFVVKRLSVLKFLKKLLKGILGALLAFKIE